MQISAEKARVVSRDVLHILIFAALVFALVFAFSVFTRCSAVPIPGWCDVYWGLMRMDSGGNPRVLIVYGDGGLGDHKLLEQIISDPGHVGKRVVTRRLAEVSLGNLKNYDLVIVEEARVMSTEKMKMFIDFATTAGKKLVWIGDSGVETTPTDELVRWNEYPGSDKNLSDAISPWIRKSGENIVSLEKLIGVRYIANYCDVKDCNPDEAPWIGDFMAEDRTHRLVRGIKADLRMYGNYAIVDVSEEGITTRVLDVDFASNLIAKDNRNLGRIFPVITTTSFGENVAYYAIPPEMLASDLMPKDDQGNILRYFSLAEKMYYGMLY